MKTEISRNSHDPEKRYSSVYQQQGRMITDADWNEQADIVKQRLDDTLTEVVGSGIPEAGGIIQLAASGQQGELCWGTAYVDGIRARLMPASGNASDTFAFDGQADLPLPGGSQSPNSGDTLFLDVWERTVTSYDDHSLMDTALNGADTCSRTQTVVQLKWCENEEDVPVSGAPRPLLTVKLTPGYSGNASNFLFRLEVHHVSDTKLVLKWSRANGAERFYRLDADGAEQNPPDYFGLGSPVFEYFTDDSEKWFGFAGNVPVPTDPEPLNVRDTQLNPDSPPPATDYPHMRRWDGYCQVDLKNPSSAVIQDSLSGEGINLDGDTLTLSLEDFTLTVRAEDGQNDTLLSGDYWQFAVREGEALPVGAKPSGIAHHYLVLGTYNGPYDGIKHASGTDGAFRFPSLSQAHDTFVNVTGDTMSGRLRIEDNLSVSGNVGIGYVNPATGLAVNGPVNIGRNQVPANGRKLQVQGDSGLQGNCDVDGNLTIGRDLTIGGNLTVNGETTQVNVTEMEVEDNVIRVNKYTNPTDINLHAGLEVYRGRNPAAQLIWDENAGKWKLGDGGDLLNIGYGQPWEDLNSTNALADNKHCHSWLVVPNGSHDPAVTVNNAGYVGVGYQDPQAGLTVKDSLVIGANSAPAGSRKLQVEGDSGLKGACDIDGHVSIAGGRWNPSNSEGDFRIGNNSYRMKIGVATAGGGRGDVRIRAHGGTNRLMLGGGTTDTLTIGETNVGIGTLAPTQKLDVDGNVKATAFIGDGSQLTGIAAGKWLDAVGGAGKIHYSSGNVGVGTNQPSVPLHVNGACRIEDKLTVKGRLYGAVEGPGGEEYRMASGQTGRDATGWVQASRNTIYVDVDTSSAGFAVTPQYYFNLIGDSGHHTVMGVGCVSNPTKAKFRVYLSRESGVTVDEANTGKWYIQWTAVGHDRLAGFPLHPDIIAGLPNEQLSVLGAHYAQLQGRIDMLNSLNAQVTNGTTGLAAVRNKTNTTYNAVYNSTTGLTAVRNKTNTTYNAVYNSTTGLTAVRNKVNAVETLANNTKSALNANAKVLAQKYQGDNIKLIGANNAVSAGTYASLNLGNLSIANKFL